MLGSGAARGLGPEQFRVLGFGGLHCLGSTFEGLTGAEAGRLRDYGIGSA